MFRLKKFPLRYTIPVLIAVIIFSVVFAVRVNPVTAASSGLTIQIDKGNGVDNTQETGFNWLVKNTGTSAISNISVRIYFNTDGSNAASGYTLEKYYDQSGVGTISGPTLASGSTNYFTVSYGTASLAAGAQWEFQTALHLSSWASTYAGSNDWYHTGYAVGALPAAYTDTNYITGYVNGTLAWGQVPGGGTAVPTATFVPPTVTKTGPTATKTNTPVPSKTNTPGGPTATKTKTPMPTTVKTNTPVPTTGATATKPAATSTTGPTAPPGTHLSNPFSGAKWFVNPFWANEVKSSNVTSSQKSTVSSRSTFVWLDSMAAVTGTNGYPASLSGFLDLAESQGATLIGIVVYDLPGRDCSALASNGELPATTAGLQTYESSYIDPIVSAINQSKYSNLRIIAVIEPDSLPNMVTNLSVSKCATVNSNNLYTTGIEYALNKLHAISYVYNYLDIGHAGWLGWSSNFNPAITLYTNLLKATTKGFASTDGFIDNTANNQVIKEPFISSATQSIGGQPVQSATFFSYNPYIEEDTYAAAWISAMQSAGVPSADTNMLVDTSRNGWCGCGGSAYVSQQCRPTAASTSTDVNTFVNQSRIDRRPAKGDWCNQNGAGLGLPPGAGSSPYQAYVWVKPPGESDGSSSLIPTGPNNPGGKGFDSMCDPSYMGNSLNQNMNTNALPNAPVSGMWFEAQFEQLVANSYPAIQ